MFASPYDLCATATFVTLTVPNIIIPAVAVIIKKALESIHIVTIHPSRLRCFSLCQGLEPIPAGFQRETGTSSLLVHHTNNHSC